MGRRGSYWAGTGRHQADFKRLRSRLVTVGGTADTPEGELLRAVTTLYHEIRVNRFSDTMRCADEWRTVVAYHDRIAAAIGPQGTWVLAVVDRAIADRQTAPRPPAPFLLDAVETLVDGCVLTVKSLATAA